MSLTRLAAVSLFLAAALAHAQEYLISTFAGGVPPPTPVLGVDMPIGTIQSVAADAMGNTYFIADRCVFKMDPNGVVTRIGGNARQGYSGDGGPATSAQLRMDSVLMNLGDIGLLPPGIAVDNSGSVYVADNDNHRVRRISPDGIITTVAGNGTPGFSGDGGPAISAQLSPVFGLALDPAGNLWIADSAANRIRRLTLDGTIATIAGTGDCGLSGDGGPAVAAQLCGPAGIAADASGNLFIADLGNNRIRQISPDGTISTVAGTGYGCGPLGDGGPAVSAQLCQPSNVAVDQAGNLFIADTNEGFYFTWWQLVRKVSPGGTITTLAGYNNCTEDRPDCDHSPGNGAIALDTLFFGPLALAVDNAGDLLLADDGSIPPQGPHIYKVLSSGALAVAVGNGQKPFSGDGGSATDAQLAGPEGVAVDSAGDVFIADYVGDRVRKVSAGGIITTVAGVGMYGASGDGGPATSAQVAPLNVAVDDAGNLFLFDIPNRSIRKISRQGMISTVATIGGNNYFVATDSSDNVFAACPANTLDTVCEISPDGTMRTVAGGAFGFSGDGGLATSAALAYPDGIALDSAGNLYIADGQNHRIRKVTPDGIITTIAGSSGTTSNQGCCFPSKGGFSGDGGLAIDAQLSFPYAVAVDSAGNVFIADSGNNRIRKVSPDGIITTIAGDGTKGYSGDGGLATRAAFSSLGAVAVDGVGNVYVADFGNNAIRILRPAQHHENHRD